MRAPPTDEELTAAFDGAQADPSRREAFLVRLATSQVRALLYRPPGEGAAAPWRNLVHWQHAASGTACVPLFTDPTQFQHVLPPPAGMVRVGIRELLSIAPAPVFVLNPMGGQGWTMTTQDLAFMRETLWAAGMACEQPSPDAPWAFRRMTAESEPLARCLAKWCAMQGVANAYLYRLDRNDGSGEQTVLALTHPPSALLRTSAIACALQAGAPVVLVRFLPVEPSHVAGIASMSLAAFYAAPDSPKPDNSGKAA